MKLAVVGLDGLSENMISHCRDELPVIDDLLTNGAGGTLRSTLPPVTLPAWTTFSTGKNPGQHGLYNMTEITPEYESPPVSPNISEGALYDAIDESVFINLQGAYGRKPQGDALLVPGGAPSVEAALPNKVKSWKETDRYRVKRDADLNPNQFVDDLISISEARFDFARRAAHEYDPEMVFVLFSSPDWLFHYLGSRGNKNMIIQLMKYLDEVLEWFVENSENLMIMSDHGFERKHIAAYPNKILENRELLCTKPPENSDAGSRLAVRLIKEFTKRSDLAHELVRKSYNRLIHTDIAENLYQAKQEDIDSGETVAWHDGWGVVYLNHEYFSQCTVTNDNYKETRQAVINVLSNSTHPDTGEQLFRRVLPGEEVYHGTEGIVPDVVIDPKPGVMLYQSPMQNKVASKTDIYNHRRDGIYAGIGEIFNDVSVNADIHDIAPTVLHILDRSVPRDMDGEVLTEILTDDNDIEMGDPITPGSIASRSVEDQEQIREQLADLGYLE